jgi:hypothetical protein
MTFTEIIITVRSKLIIIQIKKNLYKAKVNLSSFNRLNKILIKANTGLDKVKWKIKIKIKINNIIILIIILKKFIILNKS